MNADTQAYLAFYDAENAYYLEAKNEEEAEMVAERDFGPGVLYIEPTERTEVEE